MVNQIPKFSILFHFPCLKDKQLILWLATDQMLISNDYRLSSLLQVFQSLFYDLDDLIFNLTKRTIQNVDISIRD